MYLLVVYVLACVGLSTQQSDYCSPSLCPNGGPHIACNGLTELAYSCGAGSREVAMTSSLQEYVLYLHNTYRSYVASGWQSYAPNTYYPQAWRMPTVFWDDELAEIAAANARRCVYGHDKCRNTWQFPMAGQNIAIKYFYGMSFTEEELIYEFVTNWFAEYADANTSVIGKYPSGWTGPQIGHFTQIVSDRTTRVGCSLVSYLEGGWTQYLFVCNYSITNIINEPVYVAGPACGGCNTGCSTYYPGLCHENEIV